MRKLMHLFVIIVMLTGGIPTTFAADEQPASNAPWYNKPKPTDEQPASNTPWYNKPKPTKAQQNSPAQPDQVQQKNFSMSKSDVISGGVLRVLTTTALAVGGLAYLLSNSDGTTTTTHHQPSGN